METNRPTPTATENAMMTADLAATFATFTQAEKSALVSSCIIELRNDGMPLRAAVDAVLGAGTYDRIASDVYDKARAA